MFPFQPLLLDGVARVDGLCGHPRQVGRDVEGEDAKAPQVDALPTLERKGALPLASFSWTYSIIALQMIIIWARGSNGFKAGVVRGAELRCLPG